MDFICGISVGLGLGFWLDMFLNRKIKQQRRAREHLVDIAVAKIRKHNACMIAIRTSSGRVLGYLSEN